MPQQYELNQIRISLFNSCVFKRSCSCALCKKRLQISDVTVVFDCFLCVIHSHNYSLLVWLSGFVSLEHVLKFYNKKKKLFCCPPLPVSGRVFFLLRTFTGRQIRSVLRRQKGLSAFYQTLASDVADDKQKSCVCKNRTPNHCNSIQPAS